MKRIRWRGFTLSGRILLFLIIFTLALITQIVLWGYQSTRILEPTQARTEVIQSISQFLNESEGCLAALEEYRWDYGDSAALTAVFTHYQDAARTELQRIHAEPGGASEEYVLLAGAVETRFAYLSGRLDEIASSLRLGSSADAAQIYYGQTVTCGDYLLQYTRELLEQAILDNHDAFTALSATSDRLEMMQLIATLLSVLATAVLVVSLIFLLRSVVQLSLASRQISEGELDIPDVDVDRDDEVGHLARTFNEMKHSMKQQMQLLQEKNEMERTLYARETEALALENRIEAGKLQLLRSQIHPHFLFNTLNVISYNARQEGAEKTGALIASLSRLFRYALGSNAAAVPLAKEKQIVDDFYSLYYARFGERIRLLWQIDPAVELTDTLIPSFLIQPLVESAIQHGLAPKEEGGTVKIVVRIVEDLLQITVSDDGIGMSREALDRLQAQLQSGSPTGEHIGLYNVAARLRLSGRSQGLDIRSEAGVGTSACMRLPLVTAEEKEADENE